MLDRLFILLLSLWLGIGCLRNSTLLFPYQVELIIGCLKSLGGGYLEIEGRSYGLLQLKSLFGTCALKKLAFSSISRLLLTHFFVTLGSQPAGDRQKNRNFFCNFCLFMMMIQLNWKALLKLCCLVF